MLFYHNPLHHRHSCTHRARPLSRHLLSGRPVRKHGQLSFAHLQQFFIHYTMSSCMSSVNNDLPLSAPVASAASFPRLALYQCYLCTVHSPSTFVLHSILCSLFMVRSMQVCALPQSYYQRHQAQIPWQNIYESNTVTFQEDGAHHREAVLNCKENGTLEADGFVSFPHGLETGRRIEFKDAAAPAGFRLPEVFFAKRSGESLLDGKQPPIVLVVRAVTARTGAPIASIRPAVSNPFCVATRRVKGAMKVDIPSTDQEVRRKSNLLTGTWSSSICSARGCCAHGGQHQQSPPPMTCDLTTCVLCPLTRRCTDACHPYTVNQSSTSPFDRSHSAFMVRCSQSPPCATPIPTTSHANVAAATQQYCPPRTLALPVHGFLRSSNFLQVLVQQQVNTTYVHACTQRAHSMCFGPLACSCGRPESKSSWNMASKCITFCSAALQSAVQHHQHSAQK